MFTNEEIAVVRRFLEWVAANVDGDEGVVGATDEGVLWREFDDEDDGYGCSWVEGTDRLMPWVALTDPPAYRAMLRAEAEERDRQRAEVIRQYALQRERQERATLEALKRKYGG